jgi:hypothetical protein
VEAAAAAAAVVAAVAGGKKTCLNRVHNIKFVALFSRLGIDLLRIVAQNGEGRRECILHCMTRKTG